MGNLQMPSQPRCRTFLWHQRNASERRTPHHRLESRKAITDGAQALGGVPGTVCNMYWNDDAAFPEVVQRPIVVCSIHRPCEIGLYLELSLEFLNAMIQAHWACSGTTIVLTIGMHFANRIWSRTAVSQECYPAWIRGTTRLRDTVYGTSSELCNIYNWLLGDVVEI